MSYWKDQDQVCTRCNGRQADHYDVRAEQKNYNGEIIVKVLLICPNVVFDYDYSKPNYRDEFGTIYKA